MILSLIIGVITLIFLFTRLYNISIGIPPIVGALLCIVLGLVNVNDLQEIFSLIWNPTIAFVGILMISLFFEQIGLFTIIAQWSVRLSKGRCSLLFINSILFTALASAVFANDGAIMIITPLLLAKMRMLSLGPTTIVAFLMMGNIVSDTASLPLLISNLVNILAGEFTKLTFFSYFTYMLIPFCISVLVGGILLYAYYHKDLPSSPLQIPSEKIKVKDPLLMAVSMGIFLLLIVICFISGIYNIPLAFLIIPTMVVLLCVGSVRKQVNVPDLIKQTPWSIIAFSIGMYIIVYAAYSHHVFQFMIPMIQSLINYSTYAAVIGLGFFSAIFSCIINNLPALLTQMLTLQSLSLDPDLYKLLTLSVVTGCDIGSKILPTGSLATLIWLHQLKRHKIDISWGYFIKTCGIIIPPLLFIVLTTLYCVSTIG